MVVPETLNFKKMGSNPSRSAVLIKGNNMQKIRVKVGNLIGREGVIIGSNWFGGFDCLVEGINIVLVESEFERLSNG